MAWLQDQLNLITDPQSIRMKWSQIRLHIQTYRGGVMWPITFAAVYLSSLVYTITYRPEAFREIMVTVYFFFFGALGTVLTWKTLLHMNDLDKAISTASEDIAASIAQIMIVLNRERTNLKKAIDAEKMNEEAHRSCISQWNSLVGAIEKHIERGLEAYGNEKQRKEIELQKKAP